MPAKPLLRVEQVLKWADGYYEKAGRWPNAHCGRIPGTLGETWMAVNGALIQGFRGFEKGGSLKKLLAKHRGYRHPYFLPALTIGQILKWADAHHVLHSEWPTRDSGSVPEARGETWCAINKAIQQKKRGLHGYRSLVDVLLRRRHRRSKELAAPLSVAQILRWTDAHRVLFGVYPNVNSGRVGTTGETWLGVDRALRSELRGLSGKSSLYQLLKNNGRITGPRTPYHRAGHPSRRD